MITALLWVLHGPAVAGGPEVWAALHDGRLMESVERDPAAAEAVYETVLDHLPDQDPQRGELLYWLGRARVDAGDLPGALSALDGAAHDPVMHDAARTLQGRLELRQGEVTSLPYREPFTDEDRGAWVRGWPRGMSADLSVQTREDGDPALTWSLDVREGQDDHVRMALRPSSPGPEHIQFQLRAATYPLEVRVLLEDDTGQRWTTSTLRVPANKWVSVELEIADFVPADAPAANRSPDPRRVKGIILRDVTAFYSPERGANALLVDDVLVR